MLSYSVVSDSLWPWTVACQAPLLMRLLFFYPGKNTGVGCHFLLLGILLTQGLSPVSPALQMASLPAEPLGKSYDPECLVNISISINSAESGVHFYPVSTPTYILQVSANIN